MVEFEVILVEGLGKDGIIESSGGVNHFFYALDIKKAFLFWF